MVYEPLRDITTLIGPSQNTTRTNHGIVDLDVVCNSL